MGCDYSDTIKGIGPVKGLELIKQHADILAKEEWYSAGYR